MRDGFGPKAAITTAGPSTLTEVVVAPPPAPPDHPLNAFAHESGEAVRRTVVPGGT
jgi:hypothetical protein